MTRMQAAIDYLNPQLPSGLARVRMPVVDATAESLAGYGRLVDDPAECRVEIVRWPARGTRPVDADTGDQGGTTEGVFVSEWHGDILYGRNEAVGGHYILAYAELPENATHRPRVGAGAHDAVARQLPPRRRPAVLPARPCAVLRAARTARRRRARPSASSASASTAATGLYIHPDIWHEGVFGVSGTQRFFDKQGAVHARVSVDFAREFGCLLEAPIAV